MSFFTITISAIILLAGFGYLPFRLVKRNLKTIGKNKIPPINWIEILYMLIMPLMGLICYHAVHDVTNGVLYKPAINNKYFVCLGIIPIIVASYFISRHKKQAVGNPIRILFIFPMVLGISIAVAIMIEFFWIGFFGAAFLISPGFFFSVLAFPYYSLLSVVILLGGEVLSLFKIILTKRPSYIR